MRPQIKQIKRVHQRSVVFASIVCATLSLAPPIHAAGDGEGGAAAAEALFQEARKAMDAKHFSEACPKLAASHKLAPAIGTLLNLADCYEKNNQLASAWVRFHEAIALARRLGRSNREQTARERADKLEPRLIRLSISHSPHAAGTEVKLDGNVIDPTVLGTPIPIDAGKHTIEASAEGKKPFSAIIDVNEKSKSPTIDVPTLEDDPTGTKTAAESPKTGREKFTSPPKEEHAGWGTQKTIGVVAAGVGVIAIGLGAYFGLKASSNWDDAKAHCASGSAGLECDTQGVALGQDAKSSGTIATIAFVAGGALLLGGAVLFFTAPNDGRIGKSIVPLRVGVGPGSIVLGGAF